MATNLDLDDRLIDEVRRVGNFSTKKAAVTAALNEYIARHKQMEVLKLFGTIDFDSAYSSKAQRQLDKVEVEP